ncbi:MAG: hypothetical protein MUE41_01495 [Gemmatimonadaceae bacterium]|jgi:hypothetical protein|nr:hypothetical protein [Gemmatimonadaceae bacterium]
MMSRIDLADVLRRTVCDLYSNLLTRPTGAAVRTAIEALLTDHGTRPAASNSSVAVLDFTHVRLLDFSCADEIVGKLLLRTAGRDATLPSYLVFRGLHDDHIDPIETVLERYALALVAHGDDGAMLFGTVDADERAAWEVVRRVGRVRAERVASELPADPAHAANVLARLAERRLLMRVDDEYLLIDVPLAA